LDASGTDITATKQGNYLITYTTTATDETNYASSSYASSYNAQATMIKIENTVGMQPGEKATLTFDYIVDENETSVASHPEKLGAINDFRPYYYFQAGSAGRTYGTRVGAILQIGRVGGFLFYDTNADGIYNGLDMIVPNKPVSLYKKGVGDSYTFIISGSTDSQGQYFFTGLSNGTYKVDFNKATTTTAPFFTIKGTHTDPSKNSQAEYLGSQSGAVININPTTEQAKYANAGILVYNATDTTNGLKAQLNKTAATLTITAAGQTPTQQLTTTILPTFFNAIKDPTTPVQRTSNHPSIVSVVGTQTGATIEGKSHGTGKITFTIKDVYGNTAQAYVDVTVENKIPLSCNITYLPPSATNQNVVATLTGCNKAITVTNNGGNTQYTFSTNGEFTFTFADAYGNTGTKKAEVNRIDKTTPSGTLSYSTTGRTNQNVIATLTTTKPLQQPSGRSGTTPGTTFTKTYSGNTTEPLTLTDTLGNIGQVTVTITNIDKTAPTCGTRSYAPTTPTSGNVTATLSGSTDLGGSLMYTNDRIKTCTLTGNATTCSVTIGDHAGNTTTCTSSTVGNIDRSSPTCSIHYSTTAPTNQSVTATLT
jgi:hypothetical protein